MSYSRKITETESEDFANERAEASFQHAMLNGDNFESVNIANVVDGLFAENPDDLESDSVDDSDDNDECLIDINDDDYNALENYGC